MSHVVSRPFASPFAGAIGAENERGVVCVIPDVKARSPKEGDLFAGRDPVAVAVSLVGWGAPVLSVVTEAEHFGGSAGVLRDIVTSTGVPVLRKDFITSRADLEETAELGASAVLLICATLAPDNVRTLYGEALALGLEPLVEVAGATELALARELGAELVGVNNRDITAWELDDGGVARTGALAAGVGPGVVLVSESGILEVDDASRAVAAGANAVLVGTALWRAADMGAMYAALRVPWRAGR